MHAERLMQELETLGSISDEPACLTRTFLSPAMHRANTCVADWMREIGMEVSTDWCGNLRGRLVSTQPNAPVLLIGSHLDTVHDAGKFDGALGVLLGLGVARELVNEALPFHLDVLGFSDEEGVRFQTTYLGSRAMAGLLDEKTLCVRDGEGISFLEAVQEFNKEGATNWEAGCPAATYMNERLLGYLETHIEQGPVLEDLDLPLGVVESIAGQSRIRAGLRGEAGHAGTTPPGLRRDALAGAAEFVCAVERLAQNTPGLVATVGTLQVYPGASNVIPGRTDFTIDVRSGSDAIREETVAELEALLRQLAQRRRLDPDWEIVQSNAATPCSPQFTALLENAVSLQQAKVPHLVSGAGHDAVVMAQITRVALLFVRCAGGISHNPSESVSGPDVACALRAMTDFVRLCAAEVHAT